MEYQIVMLENNKGQILQHGRDFRTDMDLRGQYSSKESSKSQTL